jgi:hypothetical protein
MAEIKGLVAHNPKRYKTEVPKSSVPLGQPPEYMSDRARQLWFEFEAYTPKGVLTGADRLILAVLCDLVAEYQENPKEFAVGKYAHLIGCAARLGLSPADRNKLGFHRPTNPSPFDEFV